MYLATFLDIKPEIERVHFVVAFQHMDVSLWKLPIDPHARAELVMR